MADVLMKPSRASVSRRVCTRALRSPFRGATPSSGSDDYEETKKIYIGKGKFVEDSPEKYPDKTTLAGGWAGGELGLQQFNAQTELDSAVAPEKKASRKTSAVPKGKGPDDIYIGKGQVIKDDARKYPGKESAGLLTGATGGFAGGELGVKQFVEKSTVEPADADVVRKRLIPKDIAAVAALITVSIGTNYGFQVLEKGADGVEFVSLEDILAFAANVGAALNGSPSSPPGVAVDTLSPQDVEQSSRVVAQAASNPYVLYAAAAIGAILGSALLVQTGKQALDKIGQQARESAVKNAARAGVLAVAAVVAYSLLTS